LGFDVTGQGVGHSVVVRVLGVSLEGMSLWCDLYFVRGLRYHKTLFPDYTK
jgi:hypothetical protein